MSYTGQEKSMTHLKANGVPFTPRVHNPFSGNCPLHLRVVCGVCRHFDGDLRGRGRCGVHAAGVSGARDARRCEFWGRRDA